VVRSGEGGEQIPVRAAGAEQDSEPVIVEPAEPEPDPLDGLDQVVHRLGRLVGDLCSVPGADLLAPAAKRPAKLTQLGGHVTLEQALDELGEVARGVIGGLVIQAPQRLVRYHAMRTSLEAQELLVALIVEAFVALGQQALRTRYAGSSR